MARKEKKGNFQVYANLNHSALPNARESSWRRFKLMVLTCRMRRKTFLIKKKQQHKTAKKLLFLQDFLYFYRHRYTSHNIMESSNKVLPYTGCHFWPNQKDRSGHVCFTFIEFIIFSLKINIQTNTKQAIWQKRSLISPKTWLLLQSGTFSLKFKYNYTIFSDRGKWYVPCCFLIIRW